MSIYFGTNKPKKIYYGTNGVKKVYYGTTLVWPDTPETETGLSISIGEKEIPFGNNGNATQYAIVLEMIVTEKNYGANTMKVKVKMSIRSRRNYNIIASTPRTATITINGTAKSISGYNATINAGATRYLGTTGEVSISGASSKTITVAASVPLKVNISDGVGWIDTVSGSVTFKLPTL